MTDDTAKTLSSSAEKLEAGSKRCDKASDASSKSCRIWSAESIDRAFRPFKGAGSCAAVVPPARVGYSGLRVPHRAPSSNRTYGEPRLLGVRSATKSLALKTSVRRTWFVSAPAGRRYPIVVPDFR